jgi:CelD/BcsL family acetyltransferase involved in cellulose biosynthesis
MRVKPLDAWEEVGEEAWNQLWAASAKKLLFLSWQWQTNWWDAFGGERRLRLLRVGNDAGGLVGVLPLYEEKQGAWTLVGGADVSDYLDLLVLPGREGEVWGALLHHLASDNAALTLHSVPASSETVSLLPRLGPAHGFSVKVEREERCPVLDLPGSWEGYLSSLNGKERHELQRKMRRFERLLPGVTLRCRRAVDQLDDHMTAFLSLHRKSKRGKARFMDERMERFFRRMTHEFAGKGWLCLWLLEVRDVPLAALLCFDDGETVSLYNSGFDPERGELAPGIVLTAYAIREAIREGRRRFDFMRGEEPYKYAFGAKPEDVMRLTLAMSDQPSVIGTLPPGRGRS